MTRPASVVTFTTQQAHTKSQTSRAPGKPLDYLMVTSVQLGSDPPLAFTPPEYDKWAIRDAQPGRRTVQLQAAMAGRLERFVETCFVRGSQGFNGFTFMNYLARYTDAPTTRARRRGYDGGPVSPGRIAAGRPYVIVDSGRKPIHGMIGLEPGYTLGINGANSSLAICPVVPLMRAYGGAGIFLVTGLGR